MRAARRGPSWTRRSPEKRSAVTSWCRPSGDGAQGRVYKARKGRRRRRRAATPLSPSRSCAVRPASPRPSGFAGRPDVARSSTTPTSFATTARSSGTRGSGTRRSALVMEFLQGETLDQRIARAPQGIEWEEVQRIFSQCLDGLLYASAEAGITHRDLKPSNIFLVARWRGEVLRLRHCPARRRRRGHGRGVEGHVRLHGARLRHGPGFPRG
jgi:hypothetical protein